jgi:hypothetical protein
VCLVLLVKLNVGFLLNVLNKRCTYVDSCLLSSARQALQVGKMLL